MLWPFDQYIKWQRRLRLWVSLSWRPDEPWKVMEIKSCVWTGVKTRGESSAPLRSVCKSHINPTHFLSQSHSFGNDAKNAVVVSIIIQFSSVFKDGKVIVWDAFTTNKVKWTWHVKKVIFHDFNGHIIYFKRFSPKFTYNISH